MQHINNVVSFMQQAGQNTPEKITEPSKADRLLRAKLILEEAFELINDGLGVEVSMQEYILEPQKLEYRTVQEPDIVAAMDGAVDLLWVGVTGTSIIFGCDLEPLIEEVDRSNLSKFIDGYRREDGKWQKGPSYSPADIKGKLRDRVHETKL